MPIDYHVRPEPTFTVAELRKKFDTKTDSVLVDTADMKVDGGTDDEFSRTLTFETKEAKARTFTVPLTQSTLAHLANWLGIPAPFLKKIDADLQEYLLHNMLERPSREVLVSFNEETGIHEMRSPHLDRIDPRKVVDIAAKVLGKGAVALDGFITPKEYRFDVILPPPKTGDHIVGGLRFGQDTQHGLSPWVEVLLYRTAGTNVVEIPGITGTIDGRNVDSKAAELDMLEAYANMGVEAFDHQIEAFRDLADKPVHDASQMLMRIGREQGLPSKLLYSTAERLPALTTSTTDSNVWEVVNALANQATMPDIWYKANTRRKIEQACGAVIGEHASRCPACLGMTIKPIRPEDLEIPDPD